MTYLDSALLNLTERACRRFQLLTGRTNVWLAIQLTNLSIITYFVWSGLLFWNSDLAPRTLVALFCGGLLYALSQTIFRVPIEAYEAEAYRRVARGLRNPRRVRDALLRISFLTLSLVLCYPLVLLYSDLRVYLNLRAHVLVLSYALIVLTTVVLYVLACDPLPQCPGKLREWLRGLTPSRLAGSQSNPPSARARLTAATQRSAPSAVRMAIQQERAGRSALSRVPVAGIGSPAARQPIEPVGPG